jgi:hypothetical protein
MISRSPESSPSWDISSESSAESGFVPDAHTVEPTLEQIVFGGMYTTTSRMANTTTGGSFRTLGMDGHSARAAILGHPAGVPVGRSPHISLRGEFTRPLSEHTGGDGISYTDEATPNSGTEYVADALQRVMHVRLRRGIGRVPNLFSAPGNWWDTETMYLS